MKKKIVTLLTVLLAIATLTGCGESEQKESRKDKLQTEAVTTQEPAVASSEEETEAQTEEVIPAVEEEIPAQDEEELTFVDADSLDYSTMEEYLALPVIQQQYLEVIQTQLANTPFITDIEIYANENHVVMNYIIAEDYVDMVKLSLADIDPAEALLEGKNALVDETGLQDIDLTYAYYSEGGEELFIMSTME